MHNTNIYQKEQTMMVSVHFKPFKEAACVVTCVGGGGLAIGILQGLEAVHWNNTRVIAMETE